MYRNRREAWVIQVQSNGVIEYVRFNGPNIGRTSLLTSAAIYSNSKSGKKILRKRLGLMKQFPPCYTIRAIQIGAIENA